MARECGQGRGEPRPPSSVPVPSPSPVPVPYPVSTPSITDPVPDVPPSVTGSENDGDSSSGHRDPPAPDPVPSTTDRPRKPRVKRSTVSKAPPFVKPAVPVVFPTNEEYWFHIKELLDKALPNAPVFDSDKMVNSYINDFLHSNAIMESRRTLVYDYMAAFHAKKS